jgi:hypothetical protein
VNSNDFSASLKARREVRAATGATGRVDLVAGLDHVAHDNRIHIIRGSFARLSGARTTTAESAAGVSLSVPPWVPIAVRTGEQITTSLLAMVRRDVLWP